MAIKRISRVFQDLIDAKRILREIKLLRHLGRHDNVIEILDIMTGPPDLENFHTLYIVTQLYECDLERIISSSQRLTDQHAQYFVYQVRAPAAAMHATNERAFTSRCAVTSFGGQARPRFMCLRGCSKETMICLTSAAMLAAFGRAHGHSGPLRPATRR